MFDDLAERIRYPKILFFVLTVIAAYVIFYFGETTILHELLISTGYAGSFVAGLFYTYGFTTVPATAVFLVLAKGQFILLSGFIGGLGALAGDFLIFRFIRYSMMDEIERLKRKIFFRFKFSLFSQKYIVPIIAGFIIASPLPDELGISMLAVSKSVSTKKFAIISYLLNTAGIIAILAIGSSI